jgi:hypothetical protein
VQVRGRRDVDDVADLRMRRGRVERAVKSDLAERAVDEPLGAEHLERLHAQRPAASRQVDDSSTCSGRTPSTSSPSRGAGGAAAGAGRRR